MKFEPMPLNKILEETILRLKIKKKLKTGELFNEWPKIVGEEISKKAKPIYFREGQLTLKTENSTWSQELSFIDEELIKMINDFAGEKLVNKIRFKSK